MIENQKKSNLSSTVLVSALITMLLLFALSYFFIQKVIPLYQISKEEVYFVLIRLLPVAIGLTLALIAFVVAPPKIFEDTDDQDVLDIDMYIGPLYTLPKEDISETEQFEPTTLGFIKTEDQIKEIKPADQIYKALSRSVSFSSYPYEIVKGSAVGELLEEIGESTVDVNLPKEYLEVIEETFDNRLKVELREAKKNNYELSLAHMRLTQELESQLYDNLNEISYCYKVNQNELFVILPFYSFKQCRNVLIAFIEDVKKESPSNKITVGFSSLNNLELSEQELLHQLGIASEVASEQGSYTLIGYDSSLEG
ncbi:MAG: hypothetical protein WCY53_03935 [Sphaerochaetaceae bacterium]